MISFRCPSCSREMVIKDEHAGKSGKCRACGHVFSAPALVKQEVATPVAPESSGRPTNAPTLRRRVPILMKVYGVISIAYSPIYMLIIYGRYAESRLSLEQFVVLFVLTLLEFKIGLMLWKGLRWGVYGKVAVTVLGLGYSMNILSLGGVEVVMALSVGYALWYLPLLVSAYRHWVELE